MLIMQSMLLLEDLGKEILKICPPKIESGSYSFDWNYESANAVVLKI